MATNPFFHGNEVASEQDLLNDLITESIQIAGKDIYYLPKTNVNVSDVFQEEQVARFPQAFLIEMYPETSGFSGDREFMSIFGQEVRDRISFTISIDRFKQEVGDVLGFIRPREGDAIYFPMTGGLYQIHYVEPETVFYQLGKLYTYVLVCESFEYNNEEFSTGIPGIDNIQTNYSTDLGTGYLLDTDGETIFDEYGEAILEEEYSLEDQDIVAQNDTFLNDSIDIIDFSEFSPFSEI